MLYVKRAQSSQRTLLDIHLLHDRRAASLVCQFGGKLITFGNLKPPPVQSPQPVPRQVFVSQVTTETEFLQRSRELQAALQAGSFNNYCQAKIQNAKSDAEQDIWKFLLVGGGLLVLVLLQPDRAVKLIELIDSPRR